MPKNYFSKKILASLLAVIMLVSLMVVPAAAEETRNDVPAPATVVKEGYMDGSRTSSNTGNGLYAKDGLKVTPKNEECVNFGTTAYKIESATAGNALGGHFNLYPGNVLNLTNASDLDKTAWYYASFYVYVPGYSADVCLKTYDAGKEIIAKTTVPADTWVKLNGLIDHSTAQRTNDYFWKFEITNTTAQEAYVDDVVIAQLGEAPAAASLAVSDVDVSMFGAGSLTLTSATELDDTSVSASAFTFSSGSVVTDVKLNDANTEVNVSFNMGDVVSDTLTVAVKDVFGRAVTNSYVVDNVRNSVPAPATVVKEGYFDGTDSANTRENSIYAKQKLRPMKYGAALNPDLFNNRKAYKIIQAENGGEPLNGDFYLYPGNVLNLTNASDLDKTAWYYASFYVYVPGYSAEVCLKTLDKNKTIIDKTTVPADTWVKLNGLIDHNTADGTNDYIWKLEISNTTAEVAYVDDIVVAQLSEAPAAASLSASDVDVNMLGAGSLTLTSDIELDNTSVSASAFTFSSGSVVTDVKLNDANTEVDVSFGMSNADSDNLTVSVKDVFGRTVTESFDVNNNANLIKTLNSDTSFEGKQAYKVGGPTDYTSSGEAKSGKVSVGMKYHADATSTPWSYNNRYYSADWQTDFTLVSGKKYYYEVYAKISDDADTSECSLQIYMNSANAAGTTSATIGKQWTKVRGILDFTTKDAPTGQQSFFIWLSGLKIDEIVYMDDFKIYEIPDDYNYQGNFHVSGGEVVTDGDKATANLTLTNTYFDKGTVPVRVILATYNGDSLVDADVVEKNLGFGDVEEFILSADKGTESKIFVWKWPDLTPLCK